MPPLADLTYWFRAIMKLTDPVIKAAKPKNKTYSLADGQGLVLYIQTSGAKWWRYRYRYNEKGQMLSLGVYPDVGLKAARNKHEQLRQILKEGINPSQYRQEQKLLETIIKKNSFESVARLWWDNWKPTRTERHARYIMVRLETDIFPIIGKKPLNEITAPMLVTIIKKIESRGALDIAKRALSTCGQVLRYAVAHGLVERNAAADIKPSDVLKPTKKTNYARLDQKEVPELLRKIDSYSGKPLTKLALLLMSYTFVRTGELIGAKWDEVELDNRMWRIPAKRMKMKTPHIIPLSNQAISVFKKIKIFSNSSSLVFPSERGQGKSMSNNTILFALYRMGYRSRMTGHGFRGIASTILHEQGYSHEHIEIQLAHTKRNAVSAAYDHAVYLEPRAKMMQDWANHLDALKSNSAPFKVT